MAKTDYLLLSVLVVSILSTGIYHQLSQLTYAYPGHHDAAGVTHILFNSSPTSWYRVGAFDINYEYYYLNCPWDGKAICYDNFEEDMDQFAKAGGSEETLILGGNGQGWFDANGNTEFSVGFWKIPEWTKRYNDEHGTDIKVCWRRFGSAITADYSNPKVRANMIRDSLYAVSGDNGNFVPYDCIFEDTEPLINGDEGFLTFLEEQRSSLGDIKVGVVTYGIMEGDHEYDWNMNVQYVSDIADRCDYTIPMIYYSNGFNTDITKFVNWYREQMRLHYKAIGNTQDREILWGIANIPWEAGHNPNIENVPVTTYAIQGSNTGELGGLFIFAHGQWYDEGDYDWMNQKGSYERNESIKISARIEGTVTNAYVSILDSDNKAYKVTKQPMRYDLHSGLYEAHISGFPTPKSGGDYTVRIHVVNGLRGSGYKDSRSDALHIKGVGLRDAGYSISGIFGYLAYLIQYILNKI